MVKIASVGINILDEDEKNRVDCFDFFDNKSLSAYDIIIFSPRIIQKFGYYGKDEELKQQLPLYCQHWMTELDKACKKNKLVFCIVPEYLIVFGYGMLPSTLPGFNSSLEIRPTNGEDFYPSNSSLKYFFTDFCNIFNGTLKYNYTFSNIAGFEEKILETNDGDVLGIRNKNLIICQGIDPNMFDLSKPVKPVDDAGMFKDVYEKNLKEYNEYLKISIKFKSFLIKLYNALCKKQQIEEVPDWIKNDACFDLIEEKQIDAEIIDNQNKIKELDERNICKKREKDKISSLKDLLFATSKQLENAVNYALEIIGFNPKQFTNKNGDLQIDTFIEYDGLKIIGETKGVSRFVDNQNINQLTGNRDQYYNEECLETENMPKAILFINSYREQPLKNRNKNDAVTPKVLKLAEASSVSIVWTPDLFFVAQYIKNTGDELFAQTCREVIIDNKYGFVDFPKIPK